MVDSDQRSNYLDERFLYLFGVPEAMTFGGTIKIGITRNPCERLAELRRRFRSDLTWLEIIFLPYGAREIESCIKALFVKQALEGTTEWLSLDMDQMMWLAEGFADGWYDLRKHVRHHPLRSLLDCILPRYYPAPWLGPHLVDMGIIPEGDRFQLGLQSVAFVR